MNNYPKTYRSFIKWCNTSKVRGSFFLKKLSDLRLYDVSLKTMPFKNFDFYYKTQLFHEISYNHNPKSIEIGPIPFENQKYYVFNEIVLYNYVLNYEKLIKSQNKKKIYILIPNIETLTLLSQKNENVKKYFEHLSFFSPTKKSEQDDINKITFFLDKNLKIPDITSKKISIILNKEHDFIIYQMLKYHQQNIDTICLSDQNLMINEEDFEYIISTSQYYGIPYSQMALDLYMNQTIHDKDKNEKIIERIVHKALDYGIKEFNVSLKETNVSLRNKQKNVFTNITYEQFYKFLVNYIIKKTDT
jgi:hypothetical protein